MSIVDNKSNQMQKMCVMFRFKQVLMGIAFLLSLASHASEVTQRVVDIQTRPGISMRMLLLKPNEPKATIVLLAGGHGGLQIYPGGSMKWGDGNFLVRTRQLFAAEGLMVAVIDAPSDRRSPPHLTGFRTTAEHVADIRAAMEWLRAEAKLPVWLVGTSRGTVSAAHVAVETQGASGPDGIVLTSSILRDDKAVAVPAMPLERVQVPVLVVHHERDGCSLCLYSDIPALMGKLKELKRHQLLTFSGGQSTGDPCQAFAHHGFNGIEPDVVHQVAAWILAK